MAQEPIWAGSSSFASGNTPWGFYDSDNEFTSSADKFADWAARRLGYPIMAIELQSGSFYACFEESVTEYSAQVNQFNIKDNLLTLQGRATGSSNNLTHKRVTPTMGRTVSLAKQYGHMGVRMPSACIITKISGAIRNASGNRQATVGLFFARAADGTTAVDWGSGDDTEPILQIHADANNESGSYSGRPSRAEATGSDIAMAAGDVFYPAMKLTGVTSGGATDTVYISVNVHIKTLIA